MKKARYLINFGIENAESIPEIGTNAKMNEFEAAMGLCMLDEMEEIKKSRKKVFEYYKSNLDGFVLFQQLNNDATINYSYFPILLQDELVLKKVQRSLNNYDIFPRRYFYPSLDTLSYIKPNQLCQNSRDISSRILCLPIFPELREEQQQHIIQTIVTAL